MLDAYSEREPPPDAEIVRTIVEDVRARVGGGHPNSPLLEQVARETYYGDFGGRSALGSYAGWLAYTRRALADATYVAWWRFSSSSTTTITITKTEELDLHSMAL